MKTILSILSVILLLSSSCHNGSSSSGNNYEQNKMSLEEQEKSAPLNFLSTDGTYRGTLFGTKRVIAGTISNRATIATFKDVYLNVHFYARTGTEISNSTYVVYDFFPPNTSKTFSMRIDTPSGTKTIGWDITSATAK